MTSSVIISDQPALQMGMDRHEGVIVAYLPRFEALPQEFSFRDGPDDYRTAVAYDGRLIDCIPSDMRWWKVREAARTLGLDEVSPIWSGPAEDLRVSCLPDVPQPEGTYLAMRQYRCGPWISLEQKES